MFSLQLSPFIGVMEISPLFFPAAGYGLWVQLDACAENLYLQKREGFGSQASFSEGSIINHLILENKSGAAAVSNHFLQVFVGFSFSQESPSDSQEQPWH